MLAGSVNAQLVVQMYRTETKDIIEYKSMAQRERERRKFCSEGIVVEPMGMVKMQRD